MNPMGLMELGQIKEQEHMREALRRSALREARKQAGVTWIQLVRARLFGSRGVVTTPPTTATRPAVQTTAAAPAAPAPVASSSVAATTNATPVRVHEIRIRQRPTLVSGGAARASAPAPQLRVVEAEGPQLRVVEAAEPDCVGADC